MPKNQTAAKPKKIKFKLKKKTGAAKAAPAINPTSAKPAAKSAKRPERGGTSLRNEPYRALGVFRATRDGGRVEPASKKAKSEFTVAPKFINGAEDGELVVVQVAPLAPGHYGLPAAAVVERVGHENDPRAYSIIAIYENEIPTDFPAAAVEQAESAQPVPQSDIQNGKRVDLRDYPLVTIDGEDARDFDDAVFAEPDPAVPGGWHLLVAIADVSHYVTAHSALDKEAYKRGNSVYFPDRVVPMLPEALSNELCSLKPNVDRATMAVHLYIDAEGKLARYQFARGIMRSQARLTYTQVQKAYEGELDEQTKPIKKSILDNLFAAYAVLRKARHQRGTLELDVPEYKAKIVGGRVVDIELRRSQEAHQLIEEFMIMANVAAAAALDGKGGIAMYRVHDEPPEEKREALADFLNSIGGSLPKGNKLTSRGLARLIETYANTEESILVNEMMLRSQSRAAYSPDNIGHFGLALPHYAHFTSPIRRYADLLVHRALIRAYKLGDDGLPQDQAEALEETGEHLSVTEQRAASAERSATERYVASFLAGQTGTVLEARVSGVTHFGLFVRLIATGADGLIPMAALGPDYWVHEEKAQMLVGRRTGMSYRLGQALKVRLDGAEGLTGRLQLSVIDAAGQAIEGGGADYGRRGQAREQRYMGKPSQMGKQGSAKNRFSDRKPGKPSAKAKTKAAKAKGGSGRAPKS